MKRTYFKATIVVAVDHEDGKTPTPAEVAKAAEQSVSLDIQTDASENEIGEDAAIRSASVSWDELHKVESRG